MAKRSAFPLFTQVKLYFKTTLTLLMYEVIDTGTTLLSALIVELIIIFFLLGGFLFFSIALAALAAGVLHSWWAGTAAVAGFYVLLTLGVPLIRKPMQNIFIRHLLKIFKRTAKPWIPGKQNRI
jgi:hypothetical protein